MELKTTVWDKKTARDLKGYIRSFAEAEYNAFNSKLVMTKLETCGVRLPTLKKIAKDISKGDFNGFLKAFAPETYEKTMVRGLVIAFAKMPASEKFAMLSEFIGLIDNWAINDSVVTSVKETGPEYFEFLKGLLGGNLWQQRFALTGFLAGYVNDDYIDEVLRLSEAVVSSEYYVRMANAWLLSLTYVRFSDKTKAALKTGDYDEFTLRKAVSKIQDSFRVTKEDKAEAKEILQMRLADGTVKKDKTL